jgi:hypothetical protein
MSPRSVAKPRARALGSHLLILSFPLHLLAARRKGLPQVGHRLGWLAWGGRRWRSRISASTQHRHLDRGGAEGIFGLSAAASDDEGEEEEEEKRADYCADNYASDSAAGDGAAFEG